jgi:3-phosphoglycerate kinase
MAAKNFFTIEDFNFNNKIVLLRVDFNVPVKEGKILDDRRIKAAVPTIRYLIKNNAKIVIMSHLGRPEGNIAEELRLAPAGKRLEKLVHSKVMVLKDCTGIVVESGIRKLKPGEIAMLENLRFCKEEEADSETFGKELAKVGDLYVNDAFAVCHRANASVHSITKFLPSCAGFLLQKEIDMLSKITEAPEKPFIAILGGAKVSDKIGIIENLLKKVDKLLIGGAMMFTFLKAQGLEIGKSKVEDDKLGIAKKLLSDQKIVLPIDVVIAAEAKKSSKAKTVLVSDVPKDMIGLDIGKDTVKYFETIIKNSKTIFWNGPMGMFEIKKFAKGTDAIAKIISKTEATSIIGGGETAAAASRYSKKMTHISTGGGASLEFVEGKKLPGIQALEENYRKFKGKV